MRKLYVPVLSAIWPAALLALLCLVFSPTETRAQSARGGIELTARITPTSARPEPVRQFTFYVLTRSYEDVAKDVAAQHVLPPRDEFIDTLKVSPQLKAWLKAHDILDLTMPELDKSITPDDVIAVPEFMLAYQHNNSGGVTNGFPKAKYTEADKTDHPEKYEKLHQEYIDALKKFVKANPATISGVELEFTGINPQAKWDRITSEQRKAILRTAPELAQTKYLVAKTDTDLDGHATIAGLPPGNYWVSTLNFDADAGDARLRWDVPVAVEPGRTTRVELTNLNSIDAHVVTAP
jgi:hypothetical protein